MKLAVPVYNQLNKLRKVNPVASCFRPEMSILKYDISKSLLLACSRQTDTTCM